MMVKKSFWSRNKLAVLILLGIFLYVNPLDFDYLGAIFGIGESQEFLIVTNRYDKTWLEGDILMIDDDPLDAWFAQQELTSSVSFSRSGYVIIVDDKIYDVSVGGLAPGGNLFSPQWFASKGYTYPETAAVKKLSAGSHYVEYMVGRRVSYGGVSYEIGWSGAKTIVVQGTPQPVPICSVGTYNPSTNQCEYTLSDVTYICPSGSVYVEISGKCESDVTEVDCDGDYVDGVCYVTPDIVHDCGSSAVWDEDIGKCVSYEEPGQIVHDCGSSAVWDEDIGKCVSYEETERLEEEEEEEEEIKPEPKEDNLIFWVLGLFAIGIIIIRRK